MPRCALLAFPLMLAAGAVGCAPPAPPEPGTVVTFAELCEAKYDLPEGSYGDTPLPRVTMTGYLVPPAMFSMCSDTCSFDLMQDPNVEVGDGPSVRYSVKLGSGKNELEPLPKRYDPADFKLHTNGGEVLGFGDKVRLTGQRLGDSKNPPCQLYKVDLIEKP